MMTRSTLKEGCPIYWSLAKHFSIWWSLISPKILYHHITCEKVSNAQQFSFHLGSNKATNSFKLWSAHPHKRSPKYPKIGNSSSFDFGANSVSSP